MPRFRIINIEHNVLFIVPIKGLLLLARWMEGTARYDTQTVLREYKVLL